MSRFESLGSMLIWLFLITINIEQSSASNNTNSTTLIPTLSPTNITTTTTPTLSPTISPSLSPTISPTLSPSLSPSIAPTINPTKTKIPTFAPSIFGPFTTKQGKYNPTQQLLVNFTLNFTSNEESTPYTMDQSLKLAYSNVGIPANYIENFILVLNQDIDKDFYFYKIYSIIDAKDKSQANDYYAFIASDPDSSSHFRNILRDILLDNITNEYFDMSSIYMEIHGISNGSINGSSSDTTQIIIWFLGVSAVCAIGALVLIICWRKFSGKDENENDNAINLEFLLDPNASNDPNLLTSPMHINDNNINTNNNNNYSLHQPEDIENDDDLKPIKKKKKIKKKYFNRLQDDDDDDNDDQDDDNDEYEEEEEYEEYDEEQEEEEQEDDNYAPPQFSERL